MTMAASLRPYPVWTSVQVGWSWAIPPNNARNANSRLFRPPAGHLPRIFDAPAVQNSRLDGRAASPENFHGAVAEPRVALHEGLVKVALQVFERQRAITPQELTDKTWMISTPVGRALLNDGIVE